MKDLFIKSQFARTKEIKDEDISTDGALRVYRWSPDAVMIQIRTDGSITDSRKGKARKMVSHLTLNKTEVHDLIEYLLSVAAEIKG